MKIKITAEAKKWLTVAEMPEVKKIIADMKEYDTLQEDAQTAARIASGSNEHFEILKCEAEIAGNRRVWNQYGENSGRLDIWVDAYAYSEFYGFYNLGFYMSDIWSVDGDNNEEIRSHMYIREYKETK